MSTRSKPLTRRFLTQELNRVRFEISKLKHTAAVRHGKSCAERTDLIPVLDKTGNATLADLYAWLDPVRQELKDLSQALNQLDNAPALPKPGRRRRRVLQASPDKAVVRLDQAVKNRTITLRNLGETTIVNPRLTVNGQGNWFSAAGILGQILRPGMDQKQKAMMTGRRLLALKRWSRGRILFAKEVREPICVISRRW